MSLYLYIIIMRISLNIEKPAFGGFGLGFHDGMAVFVWGAIPGETAEVDITQSFSSHAFAIVTKIHQPSPHRIEPECPNFGVCGGCDYLHMDYNKELSIKNDIIIEALRRIGKFEPASLPSVETITAQRFGYRSHADIKISSRGDVGFFRKESNEVIAFPKRGCLLLSDKLNGSIDSLKHNSARACKIVVDAHGNFNSSLEKSNEIVEIENNLIFARSINCFFQANRFLRAEMANIVHSFALMHKNEKFIDAACGVGFFALHLAKSAREGMAFDISKESIFWAKRNEQKNSITNINFFPASFSSIPLTDGDYGAVVIDPPRAGLPKKARKTFIFLAPKRIVYVSCNPTTFARDARDFADAGYSLPRLTFIDMFPGTKHIEMVGLFEKK